MKSFNPKKGYGFIARAGGGQDVLVHVSTLKKAGIRRLSERQRVIVEVTEGRQGPRAKWIQFPRMLTPLVTELSAADHRSTFDI